MSTSTAAELQLEQLKKKTDEQDERIKALERIVETLGRQVSSLDKRTLGSIVYG